MGKIQDFVEDFDFELDQDFVADLDFANVKILVIFVIGTMIFQMNQSILSIFRSTLCPYFSAISILSILCRFSQLFYYQISISRRLRFSTCLS